MSHGAPNTLTALDGDESETCDCGCDRVIDRFASYSQHTTHLTMYVQYESFRLCLFTNTMDFTCTFRITSTSSYKFQ